MVISKHILIGENIAYKAEDILESIRMGKEPGSIIWYGITTSAETENLMYILNGMEFRHSFYHQGNLRLLGLASSRTEALELVLKLVQSGYNHNCIDDMKRYLEEY